MQENSARGRRLSEWSPRRVEVSAAVKIQITYPGIEESAVECVLGDLVPAGRVQVHEVLGDADQAELLHRGLHLKLLACTVSHNGMVDTDYGSATNVTQNPVMRSERGK